VVIQLSRWQLAVAVDTGSTALITPGRLSIPVAEWLRLAEWLLPDSGMPESHNCGGDSAEILPKY